MRGVCSCWQMDELRDTSVMDSMNVSIEYEFLVCAQILTDVTVDRITSFFGQERFVCVCVYRTKARHADL